MSQQYQVLARKYRPKNFHELVGQSHVSKALINAIDHNRLHHAYLFTGTRGVGKTTIARILSKCLNCETGVASTPCGVCSSCVAIDEGRFIDLIEIDAASRTKVEDTRELIDNVPYAPTQGRYKVYLIDEVHMLSTHSFNALLKTLEEPPEHVKFLLATTDPQKLPITIISRCLQFVLRPLPQQAISEHIANLLKLEGVEFTQPALWQLANAAKGSVRDALSLTDQAIAFGQGKLTDETVNDMLGLIDSADLGHLLLDVFVGNKQGIANHIEQMRAQMVDASSMFDGLAELLHQIAMVQLLPDVALNVNDKQAARIKELADRISADVIQLYYQIVIQGREQIKLANTPLQALEMCVLRLLAFRPLAINEAPVMATPIATPVSEVTDIENSNIENLGIESPASETANISIIENSDDQLEDTQEALISDTQSEVNQVNQYADTSIVKAISEAVANKSNTDNSAISKAVTSVAATNDFDGSKAVDSDRSSTIERRNVENSDLENSETKISDVKKSPVENFSNVTVNHDVQIEPITSHANNQASNSIATNSDLDIVDTQSVVKLENDAFETEEALEYNASDTDLVSIDDELTHRISDMVADASSITIDRTSSLQQPIEINTNAGNKSEIIVSQQNSLQSHSTESEIQTLTQQNVSKADKVVEAEASSVSVIESNDIDPRSLLKCPPMDLKGEWTVDKWDFWLQSARENAYLASDELALARQGIMTGDIAGHSVFKVAFDTKNMQTIFRHLAQHLSEQFGADVSIEIDASLANENSDKLPENRQKYRLAQAEEYAKKLLTNSPVMQQLISNFDGKISNLRLLDI